MAEQSKCCCRHTDARACLLARHPEIRRTADVEGDGNPLYWEFEDEVCECHCHVEANEDVNGFPDEPWRDNP